MWDQRNIKYFFNRFYKAEGKLIPEIYSVAEFMTARLDDCSGDMDNTFMTLRVSISVYHSKSMSISIIKQKHRDIIQISV